MDEWVNEWIQIMGEADPTKKKRYDCWQVQRLKENINDVTPRNKWNIRLKTMQIWGRGRNIIIEGKIIAGNIAWMI